MLPLTTAALNNCTLS